MSWLEFIEFVKNKDCKVSSHNGSLKIECENEVFYVEIDHEESDLTVKQV